MTDPNSFLAGLTAGVSPWVRGIIVLVLALGAALLIHNMAVRLLHRLTRRSASKTDDIVVDHIVGPLRWVLIAVAISFSERAFPIDDRTEALWRQVFGFIVPALIGWMALAALRAFEDIVALHSDITVENNLRARQQRTRINLLGRVGAFIIIFLTACLMLLSIPSVRSVGVTLMASAGLAGLAVGAAAQPALKNLIAGIQMAFTEPIRLDDVVIIGGEWGRIEEIRLTYVVVKVWDERRLVVPVSQFLETIFQNWTRESSQLLGSVFWYLDPTADIERLRAKLAEVVQADPRWDKRFFNMQVTDMKEDMIEVRALMTAADASKAFDLRCAVREAMLAFMKAEMPEALLKRRLTGSLEALPAAAGQPDQPETETA